MSKRAIVPSGSAGGSTKTIQTTGSVQVLTGVSNPGPTNEAANASDVSMLQFTLQVSTVEDARITEVTVRASGSGNDQTAIAGVELYRDVNGDGQLSVSDRRLGGSQKYNGDNGTVTFSSLAEVIPAGGRADFIVVYAFAGSALPGQTFAASIATGAAVEATGVTSNRPLIPSGSAGGATKTIQTTGSLQIVTGVSNPGPSSESANVTDLSMLQFTLTASTVEDITVSAVTVRAAGSGHDATGITSVRLFADVDGDGLLSTGDRALGGAQAYTADNGTVTFAGLNETVVAGGRSDFIVVYNLSGSGLPGHSFSASITTGAAISAVGVTSRRAIVPSGSAGGPTKTIQTSGSL
ncbi:MAG: hypothetical protein ACK4N5_26510, partial [Myxococcales bacterium]